MPQTSTTKLDNALRAKYREVIANLLSAEGEEILVTGSNTFAFPCIDEEGNEKYIEVTVKVPKGERGGEPYNGYEARDAYQFECERKAQEKAEAETKKARKIALDKAKREEKARLKAEAKAKEGI